ncbi:MAG: hypothetical protein [Siphoviridae sp. ct7UA22]|nr:MAG: hypothetical protein [Siphoviridae sp. ct7UA22]
MAKTTQATPVCKVVSAVWHLNFKSVVEFEGSTDESPDTKDYGVGQPAQYGIVKGSKWFPEEDRWEHPEPEEVSPTAGMDPLMQEAFNRVSGFGATLGLNEQTGDVTPLAPASVESTLVGGEVQPVVEVPTEETKEFILP